MGRITTICSASRNEKQDHGGELLLCHSDNLSKTLQAPRLSAADGQKVTAMTVQTLQSLRENDKFELFWSNTLKKANDLWH